MRTFFIILFFMVFSSATFAQRNNNKIRFNLKRKCQHISRKISANNPNKATAIALDLSMGFLGVHRLYLGTTPKVPVIYAITLGGGGFLVLTDLVIIATTKDLKAYEQNNHVFMWVTED